MKIKLYVDWAGSRILDEKRYKAQLAQTIADEAEYRYYEDDYLEEHIEQWLDEHHCSHIFKSVFRMSEDEKKEVLDMCRKGYEEAIEQNFAEEWEEITVEI